MKAYSLPSEALLADDAHTRAHFEALASTFGADVRALDWGSRASQERRFEVLASIGNLHGARVLDVGCGQADLQAWLLSLGIRCDYSGIDLSPAMIAHCRRRFPAQSFEVCNLFDSQAPRPDYDFVFASGIFYLRKNAPEAYLRSMVERMFSLCTRGLAFNSLSSWNAAPATAGEFRADPIATLGFCAQLTSKLELRHEYHPNDFALLLHKERAP